MGLRKLEPCGPDLHKESKESNHAKNKKVLGSLVFVEACGYAGIKPTLRQASKWRQGRGLALQFKAKAVNVIKATT